MKACIEFKSFREGSDEKNSKRIGRSDRRNS